MSPSVTLSLLLASLYGLLCHAIVGLRWRQLPCYWLAAIIGYFAGFAVSTITGLALVRLGTIPLFETAAGALVALLTVWWLIGRHARTLPRQVE